MILVRPRRPLRPLVLLLTVAAGATACAGPAGERAYPTATERATVVDGAWLVPSYTGPLGSLDPGADSPIVVDLNSTTMTLEGAAGCGPFFGSFSIGRPGDDEYAGFTVPGRSESGCAPSVAEVAEAAIAAIEGTPSYGLSDGRLELAGPDSFVVLEPAN